MGDVSMKPVVFLMGPTATGKTEVAIELLNHYSMEIISVDSALVYRGLDIGTAKPDKDTLLIAPHRLVDICDPVESYSAARFRNDALQAIEEIEARGNIPLLVGGTGLYFRALEHGLSQLPEADPRIRHRLDIRQQEEGLSALYAELKSVDPQAAERISANDPQRITRALEVFHLTGRAMTALQQEAQHDALQRKIMKYALVPSDRDTHRAGVQHRFMKMLENGLLEEVKTFYQQEQMHAALPSMRMVGYRQVWNHLDGLLDYEEMVNHAIVATRQLAKRQMTWLRKENDLISIDSLSNEKTAQLIQHIGIELER